MIRNWILGLAAAGITSAAMAAVVVNENGTGFIGKGDVQTAFGWNNKELNENAGGVSFETSVTAEHTWICDRDNGPQTQERARDTTTTGLISHVTRDNKRQITGFTLTGFSSSNTTSTGPQLGSCPTGWTASAIETTTGATEVIATHGTTSVTLQ
ncbi:hypothetical protein [Caldimonas tepidiphila]|uniref:hypothetical protein n=1 Tax=Caldimonas tepidiphila TaxID=2315841 RepID=UPI001300A5FB|nr:hypothetical protein [Caldimonas tepidiphila]